MGYFSGKRVFITGASSGIGEGLAKRLANEGASIGIAARRVEELERIRESIEKSGGRCSVYKTDVSDLESLRSAAKEFSECFGGADILIANAGIGGNNEATRSLEPEAVKNVIDVNLIGAVNTVGAFLPIMKRQNSGQICAVSSLAGVRGLPRSGAYCASKAGMTAFFESLRIDAKEFGIDVTIIKPGFIKTPLTAGRDANMPFLMELDDAVGIALKHIERRKPYSYFPWQLATIVRLGRFFPVWLYDRIAGGRQFRE